MLSREAETFEWEVAVRLMGDCGLRVQEVLDVKPKHISRMSDGEHFELEVVGEKDTTGEYVDGKHREIWLPRDVEATIKRYIQEADVDEDEPLVPRAERTSQYWVTEATERAAVETGDEDFRRISTHGPGAAGPTTCS